MGKYPKPNKAEQERLERMIRLGCCYCAELCLWMTAEVHHICEGNKRLGHWYTLPACPGHHRNVWLADQYEAIDLEKRVSLANGSKIFEEQYPDEKTMWMRIQRKLGLSTDWPESKIIPRKVS